MICKYNGFKGGFSTQLTLQWLDGKCHITSVRDNNGEDFFFSFSEMPPLVANEVSTDIHVCRRRRRCRGLQLLESGWRLAAHSETPMQEVLLVRGPQLLL